MDKDGFKLQFISDYKGRYCLTEAGHINPSLPTLIIGPFPKPWNNYFSPFTHSKKKIPKEWHFLLPADQRISSSTF
ncbi:MAG: hypothetical protein N0C90_11665 [Candidatus Thiodiazotropha endolucinida]|nr:hypothetical protein [Candidatus Thiodiazotropha taylori]MCW4262017.1 hypothetical protein [Candidatus Thiodiazotropha endolucinida]